MAVDPDRLETVVLARLATSKPPFDARSIAQAVQRFAPAHLDATTWQRMIEDALRTLATRELLDEDGALRDREELGRRTGIENPRSWAQVVDRALPALSLGIAADDARAQSRLVGRDAWAAAIAARALGIWASGSPPSMSAVCDAFAWRQLGLAGKAKRFPPEVRALFFQRELATDAAPADRLVRLYAARELGAPRADLRSLRDALVRRWLQATAIGERAAPAPDAFADQVRDVTRNAREGVFGDRKVFISSVWKQLRDRPRWGELTLDEFKTRLVRAHKSGDLVLARADLVAAMDPMLVETSEIRTDGASFHFIVRETT